MNFNSKIMTIKIKSGQKLPAPVFEIEQKTKEVLHILSDSCDIDLEKENLKNVCIQFGQWILILLKKIFELEDEQKAVDKKNLLCYNEQTSQEDAL